MKAHAIIGANYGDEGKGLMTDYFCQKLGADMVVRFNGGAQAGHTVVTPEGERHVFHHYGSGSFLGVPTFLSKYFVVNPILFVKENFPTKVYAHPGAYVTIPLDMLLNQAIEQVRGAVRHGSCGIGINETMQRSRLREFRIEVSTMLDRDKYHRIIKQWFPLRLGQHRLERSLVFDYDADHWGNIYFSLAERFLNRVIVTPTPPAKVWVFEGAQGLLLDKNNDRDFPFVTNSNTGIKNVLEIAQDLKCFDISATYATRSYLTRHGAGPLPGETERPGGIAEDLTNIDNEYQGALRYAPLNWISLLQRIASDAGPLGHDIAVTHLDEIDEVCSAKVRYASYGPTRTDLKELRK